MADLIIGCGYLGTRVAARWREADRDIRVLTRSTERATRFREQGMTPILGDVTDPDSLAELATGEYDTVLYAVGYDRAAAPSKREVYLDGLTHALERIALRCRRFIFISSTSVYGVSDGAWVNEESITEPETESGEICLAAEELVTSTLARGAAKWSILRLAGIYGPDRLLRKVDMLRDSSPLPGNPDAWLNLVHVDDAARVVLAAEQSPSPAPLYLVADDESPTREAYYRELARLVDAPPPRFDQSAPAKRTSGRNKRCRNDFVKKSLGFRFQYPTYETGLPAAIRETAGLA